MLSDQYELDVLRELRKPYHSGWLNATEIAEAIDVPTYTIRAALDRLRRRRLIDRGGNTGTWGRYSITEQGIQELCQADQLKLIK